MPVDRSPPPPPSSSLRQENLTSTMVSPLTSHGSDPQINLSALDKQSRLADFITHRIKRKFGDEDGSVIDQMKEMFASMEAKQNAKFERLLQTNLEIKEQNYEIRKSLEFLSAKYDTLLEEMDDLKVHNNAHDTKIRELENKIEQLERSARNSSIEIRNLPKQPAENQPLLRTLVKKVGNTIQQEISDSDIQDVYRLKTKKESNNHIVVNFTTTSMKDGFIKQCRAFNKENKNNKLHSGHLELPGSPKPIFIDESLTINARRLSYMSRQIIKNYHYHSTWTSYGKVYIRKSQDSPAIRIDSEEDLTKLIPK
ncbi:hypothetical protein O0L34_g18521 [Tuta absoluta]|nr:hypothetical protein O0L34_g18521 [Tuta absoluta]